MREKRDYSSRSNLHTSEKPKRKFLLIYEGSETEKIYFDAVSANKVILGIDNLISIVPVIRNFSEEGWSNPKKLAEAIINNITEQEKGEFPYRRIVEWITEYINENRILTIGCKKIKNDLDNICRDKLSVNLEDIICFSQLHSIIEEILSYYIDQNKKLKIQDLPTCVTSIIDEGQILYDKAIDVLCLIVDRDYHSFISEQYDEVINLCKQNSIRFYITNPCFEFWLLMHFDDVDQLDTSKLSSNPRSGHKTYAESELCKRLHKFKKNKYDADRLVSKIDLAIKNEKRYCENITGLKDNIGSNVGLLITKMRETI